MKLNRKGMFTINEMMIVGVVAVTIMVIAWPGIQNAIQNSRMQHMSHILFRIQALMNDMYQEQNPNEYPADAVFPNNFVTWVAPTNLQDAQELMEILNSYCKTFQGVNFNLETGQFICTYQKVYVAGNPPIDTFQFVFTAPPTDYCVDKVKVVPALHTGMGYVWRECHLAYV